MKFFNIDIYFIFVFILGFSISSCNHDSNDQLEDVFGLQTISILKNHNYGLETDTIIKIGEDSLLMIYLPYFENLDSVVIDFTGHYSTVKVKDVLQESGVTANNFNERVNYVISNEKGNEKTLGVILKGYSNLPVIKIETEGHQPITSKTEYINATLSIENCPEYGVLNTNCEIRGRGNHSWGTDHESNPYKIKFQDKLKPFDFFSNKDWVLVDLYCDKSLLRSGYIWEMSRMVQLEYTPEYKIVELYLNDRYEGTYYFTDQVEKGKHRVEIDDDGFFIEDDNVYSQEPLWFTTDLCKRNYTFKYPKAAKGAIREGDDSWNYIVNYMNEAEYSLVHMQEKDVDYSQYFDIESFAKWFLVGELSALLEANYFYILPNRKSKLKMYPLWDLEFSFGITARGTDYGPWALPPVQPDPYCEAWRNERYFKYMVKDHRFVETVKDEWHKLKPLIPELKRKMQDLRTSIIYSQKKHFERYPILNKLQRVTLVAFGSWEAEADYLDDIFEKRQRWMDSYLDKLSDADNN